MQIGYREENDMNAGKSMCTATEPHHHLAQQGKPSPVVWPATRRIACRRTWVKTSALLDMTDKKMPAGESGRIQFFRGTGGDKIIMLRCHIFCKFLFVIRCITNSNSCPMDPKKDHRDRLDARAHDAMSHFPAQNRQHFTPRLCLSDKVTTTALSQW
jgi:hypothetical protein